MVPHALRYCTLLFLAFSADGRETSPNSSLLFEQDQFARDTFDANLISPGLFVVNENEENLSNIKLIRSIDEMLGQIKESTDRKLFPTSTAWKFFRSNLAGHIDNFVIRSRALELHYLYANSSGLIPSTIIVLRRGNSKDRLPRRAYSTKDEVGLFPMPIIMHKKANGTFEIPSPFQDFSTALALGNDTFGRLGVDCSVGAPDQTVDIAGFTEARREDCMGAVAPISDWSECWHANNNNCGRKKFTKPCYRSSWLDYDRRAFCAYLRIRPLDKNDTFMDLLEEANSWSFDPPIGSGFPWQQALLISKSRKNKNSVQENAMEEARNQLDRTSDAVDQLIARIAISEEKSLSPRPTSIDLMLVCVAVLSALLAIDAVVIYKLVSRTFTRWMKNKTSSVFLDGFTIFFVAVTTSSPALITAAVVVYQETKIGTLNMLRGGNGWHARHILESLTGENIWLIRRIIITMDVSTSYGVRPLYIAVPLILAVLDFSVELCVLLKYHSHKYERQPGEALQQEIDSSLDSVTM
ncbi:unnamed protein product [Agarophyton chilense]